MIINDRRGIKAEADRDKIRRLIPYIDIKKSRLVFDSLTKKERGLFLTFQKKNGMVILEIDQEAPYEAK